MKKGTIALDVDGTTTPGWNEVHPDVVEAITSYAKDGWEIVFITGRCFTSVDKALGCMQFPYRLAVQNGAVALSMPDRAILHSCGVGRKEWTGLDDISRDSDLDYALFTGPAHQDQVFYRPERYSPEMRRMIEQRAASCGEVWTAVDDYHALPVTEAASVKFVGPLEYINPVVEQAKRLLGMSIPLIRDPVTHEYWVAQGTHREADKGCALKRMSGTGPVIAAGDDLNDLAMLQVADVAIAMEGAPQAVLDVADFIAPSAKDNGLIEGLLWAMEKLEGLYP